MEKIGIIVGTGNLPYFFYENAVSKGYDVYPIGLFDQIDERIKKTPNYVKINVGELGKLLSYLIMNKIDKLIMLGKVEKSIIFHDLKLDDAFTQLRSKLPDRKDETLVLGIISVLRENGIEILPQNFLMENLLSEEKVYTERQPDEKDEVTIKMGVEAAKMLGKLDVGQTVVLKDRAVVALEGVEGTDATIERAGKYVGKGTVIVKMSRPQQDMRVDVPAIGMKTLDKVIEVNGKGIVVEAGKVLFLDKEAVIKKANKNNIFIVGTK